MTNEHVQKEQKLTKHAIGLIVGLTMEYILGMTTTFFVSFPEHASEKTAWEFVWKQIPLALHIVVGLILLLGSIAFLVMAIKAKHKTWIIASSIGSATILAAVLGGSLFVSTQSDMYSFIMGLSFLAAVLAYGWGIYASKAV